jgi:hypothetical protein
MRIALSTHKQLCKVNVKKQQSDPRHETPPGSPGAATVQLVAFAAYGKEQQQRDAQREQKKSTTRRSVSTHATSSSRSNNEEASSQLAMVSMFGAARAYQRAHEHTVAVDARRVTAARFTFDIHGISC